MAYQKMLIIQTCLNHAFTELGQTPRKKRACVKSKRLQTVMVNVSHVSEECFSKYWTTSKKRCLNNLWSDKLRDAEAE